MSEEFIYSQNDDVWIEGQELECLAEEMLDEGHSGLVRVFEGTPSPIKFSSLVTSSRVECLIEDLIEDLSESVGEMAYEGFNWVNIKSLQKAIIAELASQCGTEKTGYFTVSNICPVDINLDDYK